MAKPTIARDAAHRSAHGRTRAPIATLAFLPLLLTPACDREITKVWDSGGRVEARVSAQTCPSVSALPQVDPPSLGVRASCGNPSRDRFDTAAEVNLVHPGFPHSPGHREAWSVSCFRTACSLVTLGLDSVRETHEVAVGDMNEERGTAVRRNGVVEIKFDSPWDEVLRIDSLLQTWTFEGGGPDNATRGTGTCSRSK